MFRNYLKIALRNLLKRKAFTLINILGLATGMAVCLLIVLFVQDELSFDNFHKNGNDIYRMVLDRKYPGRITSYSIIPPSIGAAVKHEFPEVLESTRIFDFAGGGKFFVKVGDKIFEESHVLAVDSNFFRVFSSTIIEGDAASALQKPNTIVLNERTAKKYFGSAAAAVGKALETDGGGKFVVSGVVKDWPENSHFAFDLLLAGVTFQGIQQINYTGFAAHTYLLLNSNASPAALEAKFPHIIDKYVSGEIGRSFNMSYQQFQAAGNGYHYYLQPLKKIHLISDLEGELKVNGSIKAVYVFGVIAIFILCIACINFINLSTARSVERAKEVGIRKTFGSDRSSLVRQFLIESVMISFLSMLLAGLIILLVLPLFNKVSGKDLSAAYFLQPIKIVTLLLFSFIVGLIAGLYPAFVLSSFKPIMVLKGKFKSNKYGMLLRNGLVVFQFAVSVILIICTVIVNRQMKFMLGDKLGFSKDHIVEIERTNLIGDKTKAFKAELLKIPGVEMVSTVSSMPGQAGFFGTTFQEVGSKQPMTGRSVIVDDQFASTINLELKEGRFFSKEFTTDSLAVVLNEKAVEELGLKNAVGSRLSSPDGQFNAPDGSPYIYTVVGVLKDFHFQSLHQKITPLVIVNTAKFKNLGPTTAVRIKGDDFKTAIEGLQRIWTSFVPERPFHYSFFDQKLAEQYKAEETAQRVFTIFSSLAIFIACIGLLGLAAYTTQQRIREISVRKVLGASAANIITMLSKDFLKLVTISSIVAFPIAWWAMHSWLQNFAYHTVLSWWVFLMAGLLAAAVALLTISFQAVKAALMNPVKNLRSE